MRPDWKPVEPGDPLYDAGTPKWVANAYGHDDLRASPDGSLPDVGPDDHTMSNGYWTITRVPNTNTIGSRFVAQKV